MCGNPGRRSEVAYRHIHDGISDTINPVLKHDLVRMPGRQDMFGNTDAPGWEYSV